MVLGLFLLLTCQLLGELIVHVFGLIVPGPVIGMIIMLIYLIILKGVPKSVDASSSALIKYIALLFVPAGVGVVLYLSLIAEEWLTIVVASMGATILTLLGVYLVFSILPKKDEQ